VVDLSVLSQPVVLVAIIGAIGTYIGIRYRTHGKTLRDQMKEFQQQNKDLRQEVDNLKIQLSPNQTPCIWVNGNGEIVNFNGSAILKIFTRLSTSSQKLVGKKISDVIGYDNSTIVKQAIESNVQSATSNGFIIGGKLTVKFAVAYVIYDNEKNDAMVELQIVV
jgi:sugar-specific transcriptional regulator TrmB